MLRQDLISRYLIVFGVVLTLFLVVFVGWEPLLIPILLLFGSGVLRIYVNRKVQVDEQLSEREKQNIVYYTLIALLAMLIGGLFVENLFQPKVPASVNSLASSMPVVATLFTVDMAVCEEQFFRGELFDLFSFRYAAAGIVVTAIVFALYHLNVYGSSPEDLAYVLVAGVVLAWVGAKTGRVAVPMLAHVLNNLLGIVALIPVVFLVLCVLVLAVYRRRIKLWEI